jgi:hypothetical protein
MLNASSGRPKGSCASCATWNVVVVLPMLYPRAAAAVAARPRGSNPQAGVGGVGRVRQDRDHPDRRLTQVVNRCSTAR